MSFLCPPGSYRGLEDRPRILDQRQWEARGLRGEGNYVRSPQDRPHFCNSAVTQPGVLARMGDSEE